MEMLNLIRNIIVVNAILTYSSINFVGIVGDRIFLKNTKILIMPNSVKMDNGCESYIKYSCC